MASQDTDKVILYDLATGKKPESSFSANPLKVRLALNFKDIAYDTEWLRFPEIKPALQDKVAPNAQGRYTVATVRMPNGKYVMDSANILPVLESFKPLPSLHLDDPMVEYARTLEEKMRIVFRPAYGPVILDRLDKESGEFFVTNRPYVTKVPEGGFPPLEQVWEDSKPLLKEGSDLLNQNKEGPFFCGKEPSYADIHLLALVCMIRVLAPETAEKIVTFDDAWKAWYAATKVWTRKMN